MDEIELDNIDKGRVEEEQDRERKETSFTERTEETEDDYDDIRSRINSEEAPTQSKTNEGFDDEDDSELSRQIQDRAIKKAVQRYDAIQALESLTGTRFNVTHGESSKELIDYVSDIKYSEKDDRLIALKFKGKDVKLTAKGKLDGRSAKTANKNIVKAIEDAKVEYEGTAVAVVDKRVGFSVSDDARKSVRENVIERTEANMQEIVDEIEERDSVGNLMREVRGIRRADRFVEYEDLEDPNQKRQFNDTIKSLRIDAERYRELRENEKYPTKKILYQAAKDGCVMKEINMKMKANEKPESKLGQNMIEEETDANDLTRFERFKKWAKENLVGVSAVAISVAGIITTAVVAGRNAVKKGAKAVGQFGKALANLAKKAGPAIATILNVLAQVLTWGAKALEFLFRNLWIVALFLTYLVYDTVKERMKNKKLN